MVDEDSHSTDLSVSGEEAGLFNNFIGSLHFLVLNESKVIQQRWLRRKIAQKCLEILLLLYNLPILASDQKKFLSFRATFVTKSNFWLFFEQYLSNFLRNNGKLFGESRATCGKPVGSVVHSFNYSFTDSFIHSFIHSFFRSFVSLFCFESFVRQFIYSFVRSSVYLLSNCIIHSLFHLWCCHNISSFFIKRPKKYHQYPQYPVGFSRKKNRHSIQTEFIH